MAHQGQDLDAHGCLCARASGIIQAFNPIGRTLAARQTELGRAGREGVELQPGIPGAAQQLSAPAPQSDITGAQLLGPFFQLQLRRALPRITERGGRRTGFDGQIASQGFQRHPAQAQACLQSAFDLHVKPGLDGARHKLVGHAVNQQTGRQAHHHKNGSQFRQQAGAETPGPPALVQAKGNPGNGRKQERRNGHIEHEQKRIVLLVQGLVVGGQHEHVQQCCAHQQHGRRAPGDDAAHQAAVAAQGGIGQLSAHRFSPVPVPHGGWR